MLAMIIILFVIGAVILTAGFIIKEDTKNEYGSHADDYIEHMLEERMNQVEQRLGQSAKMSATNIRQQTEQELEKLSREKLSAVDEYSDQVIDRINKNHNEVMFLYGLLSDKQKELDKTVESLNNAQKELQLSNRLNIREKNNASNNIDNKSEEDSKIKEVEKKEDTEIRKTNEKTEKFDKRSAIMTLAQEGKTDVEIAKILSMGVGEVRLFLELGKGV